MKVKLINVRLAFPQLFEARSFNGDDNAAFSASFIMEPDHPSVDELAKATDVVGKEKWGAKWDQTKKELTLKDKLPLHDGDIKANYAGFAGNVFVNARNKTRPSVVDRDTSPLVLADGKPYAGCYVIASLELWAQDNNYGKRINATLRGVQFLRDGEAFSGGAAANEDEFEAISDDELLAGLV